MQIGKIASLAALGIVAVGFALGPDALASVVIGGTRVIYNAGQREVTLKLTNNGTFSALAQAWIDDGNAAASPTASHVPFTLAPPVSRIDPGRTQTLRILYTGEALPRDRESLFWLNVLEVPPKPRGEQARGNYLQFAVRSRIKLFFRPAGLKGKANDAPAQLVWRLISERGSPTLEARNPTAYHVSFTSVEAVAGSRRVAARSGGMVGPGETHRFVLSGGTPSATGLKVHYRAINDYGGVVEADAALAR